MLEKDIQKKLIKKIKVKYQEKVWIYKTNDLCRVGIPDVIMCFYGHFVAIELKRYKQRRAERKTVEGTREWSPEVSDSDVTAMQKTNIAKINWALGSAFVGRTVPEIIDKLEKIRHSLMYFQKIT